MFRICKCCHRIRLKGRHVLSRVLLLNKTSGLTPSLDTPTCGTQDEIVYEFNGFAFPKGLCSLQGLIYVADSDNNAVRILEVDLGTVRMLDILGLNQPAGLSCSEYQGRIWLCNTVGNQVYGFDTIRNL